MSVASLALLPAAMRMRLAVVVGVLPVGVAEVGHRNRKKKTKRECSVGLQLRWFVRCVGGGVV